MSLAVYFSYPARVTCYQEHRIQSAGCNRLQVFPGTVMQEKGVKETWNIGIYCWCQPAKSIRSQEHARRGWERKLQQRNSTAKMGSRGSDTSPRRDAVWHQLYSASHIYTEEREKDKTVNVFFVDLYILQTVTRNLESMGMAPCYFLHQITFLCAWEVCTELQVPAVNKHLISGVVGQRAMFASKPSRTEAAPRAVSFR